MTVFLVNFFDFLDEMRGCVVDGFVRHFTMASLQVVLLGLIIDNKWADEKIKALNHFRYENSTFACHPTVGLVQSGENGMERSRRLTKFHDVRSSTHAGTGNRSRISVIMSHIFSICFR